MFVVCVEIHVRPERLEAFIEATRGNHLGTRREAGNLRFDLLQSEKDPEQFMLYEVYLDQGSFESHQQTAHYVRWRDTVKDWMATPRQAVRYRSLLPEAQTSW